MSDAAGPWIEDARRLLALLETAAQASASAPGDARATAGHAVECTWCPLCQALRLARAAGPDVLDRVAEAAARLATALREEAATGPPPAAAYSGSPGLSTVRIDITD